MRLTCERDALAVGIGRAVRAISQHWVQPIGGCLLLKADDGKLTVVGTGSGGMSISCDVEAVINDEGMVAVLAATMKDLVNAIQPGCQVELEADLEKYKLEVTAPGSHARIDGLDGQLFPSADMQIGMTIILNAEEFKTAAKQLHATINPKANMPILAGIYFNVEDSHLTMMASDQFRASICRMGTQAVVGMPLDSGAVIPAQAIKELIPLLGEAPLTLTMTEKRARFLLPRISITSQLVPGEFPDLSRLVPDEFASQLTVRTEDLLWATKQASVFTSPLVSSGIDVKTSEGVATMSRTALERGASTSTFGVEVEGDDMGFTISAKYLLMILGVIGTEQIKLSLTADNRPMMLRPVEGNDFTHMIARMEYGERTGQ